MEEGDCYDIGELLCVMTNKRLDWSVDKCIQVFEIIKEIIPESQSLISEVIDELKQAESSYPPPVPVLEDSEELLGPFNRMAKKTLN